MTIPNIQKYKDVWEIKIIKKLLRSKKLGDKNRKYGKDIWGFIIPV